MSRLAGGAVALRRALLRRQDPWAYVGPAVRRPLVIRELEGDHDHDALARLLELDDGPPLRGRVLAATVGGELWAAIAVDSYATAVDPRRPTAGLVLRLAEAAFELRSAA